MCMYVMGNSHFTNKLDISKDELLVCIVDALPSKGSKIVFMILIGLL